MIQCKKKKKKHANKEGSRWLLFVCFFNLFIYSPPETATSRHVVSGD